MFFLQRSIRAQLPINVRSGAAAVALLGALLLSACGSSVKLNEVPVSDGAGVPVDVLLGASGQGAGGEGSRDVASVTAGGGGMSEADAALGRLGRFVFFDYDSAAINPEFGNLLQRHAEVLRADPQRQVALQGHTDERGGREYNLALGQRRAEAVQRNLGLLGVSPSQMEAVSFGQEKPLAVGSDEAAHSQNRRVELSYR